MKRLLGLTLVLSLLWAPSVWAVSKQLLNPGTPITFNDAATAGSNYSIDFSATGTGTGKYSDRVDKGAGAQVAQWVWNCQFSLTGANTVGQFIEVYLSWSDGTNADGGIGTTKGSLATADKRRNLKRIGTVVIDQATSNTIMTGSGQAFIPTRYFSLAYYNATALPFQTSTTLHKCTFTPSPFEMQ